MKHVITSIITNNVFPTQVDVPTPGRMGLEGLEMYTINPHPPPHPTPSTHTHTTAAQFSVVLQL